MPDLEYIQKLTALLQRHAVFTAFSPEEVAEFARRAKISFYEQGAQIIKQDEKDDKFFVTLTGQLRAIDVSHDPPRLLNYLPPGSIFGTRAILRDAVRAATVEVVIDAHVATYTKEDWDWLVTRNDRVINYFQNLEREFDKPSLLDFPGRQWDEVVVTATKRHILAFLATLVWPIVFLIAPVVFLLAAELLGVTFLAIVTDNLPITILFTVPFVILSAALTIYNYLDWRNDDFIVTTKRVIHIERVLFYGEQRDEAPLTRIQDVTAISYDFLERFFDFHDLEIKTAGAGILRIDGVPMASEIRNIIFHERDLALARVGAADLGAIRQMIARHLGWEKALEKPVLAVAEAEGTIVTETKTRRLPWLLHYLWPRVKEVTEEENETVIVWRKHYYVLLAAIFLPLLLFLISLYALLASYFGLYPFRDPAGVMIQIILGLITLVSIVWYLWRYDSWRKDFYMVTPRRIVDVEGTPFRLRGEQRREGTFDTIQNITYDIPNFFSKLLNLGNVVIETAGTERTFTFEKVFNPSAVQEEIFNRMALFQQRQREKIRDATTDRLVEVIREYHYLFEKTSPLPGKQQQQ